MSEDRSAENWLFRLYRHYIGEPETETDVYVGFGLFFGGIAAGTFALALFGIGAGLYGLRTPAYFALAQPGYVLGLLAVPIALLGVVVLLPTKRRVLGVAIGGLAITGVAAAVFLSVYPAQWFEFGPRNTLVVVGTYAVGMAAVIAATGAALVAQQLDRARPPSPSEITPDEEDPEPTVTEETVRADIEAAMADVELTWGGVEKPDGQRLRLATDYADEVAGQVDAPADRTVSEGGVERQVAELNQLKGGTRAVATSASTVDDQTTALNALKAQKQRDEVPTDAPTQDEGALGRLLTGLGLR